MARHISYFKLTELPALNVAGATSNKLKPAPWNHAYRYNGNIHVETDEQYDEDFSEYDEYEDYTFEQMEAIDATVVEYMTPRGWSLTPMWSRF